MTARSLPQDNQPKYEISPGSVGCGKVRTSDEQKNREYPSTLKAGNPKPTQKVNLEEGEA
jgi:hypothetical protein